jgi:hypothetical protein
MNFKELFDKEFLYESKKEDKKSTKIFYKFDINIKKIDEAEAAPDQQPVDQTAIPQTDPTAQAPADQTMTPAAPVDQTAIPQTDPTAVQPAPVEQPPVDLSIPLASVVTEDDEKESVEINDEDNIIRKLEGEVVLSEEEVDEIQTIEDIITKLTETKVDGIEVLDEFTADILQVMVNPATQQMLKDKIGKESTIFAEIIYGKKKEESAGLRVIKRKNSELLTTSMMIDNKIINSKYNKETLDKRITEYRNSKFEQD